MLSAKKKKIKIYFLEKTDYTTLVQNPKFRELTTTWARISWPFPVGLLQVQDGEGLGSRGFRDCHIFSRALHGAESFPHKLLHWHSFSIGAESSQKSSKDIALEGHWPRHFNIPLQKNYKWVIEGTESRGRDFQIICTLNKKMLPLPHPQDEFSGPITLKCIDGNYQNSNHQAIVNFIQIRRSVAQ